MGLVGQWRTRKSRGLNAFAAIVCAFLLTLAPTMVGFAAPNYKPQPEEVEEKHAPWSATHAVRSKLQREGHRTEYPRISNGHLCPGLTHPILPHNPDSLLSRRLTPLRC